MKSTGRNMRGPNIRSQTTTPPPTMETLEGRLFMTATVATGVVPWMLPRVGQGVPTPTPTTPTPTTPTPTTPTPSAGNLQFSKAAVVFNDVRGGGASPGVGLTIRNAGSAAINLANLAVSGGDASQFVITSKPSGALAPGGTASVTLTYNAPTSTANGIHTSSLVVTSDDALAPTATVPLRGLATNGTGGQNEPSLQRIFDLYQLNLRTGDTNPADTNLFSNAAPLGATDELFVQRLAKADPAAAVTITPLAAFAGGDPVVRFGYYTDTGGGAKTEVLTVPKTDPQTVNPGISGASSFDPGSGTFGLYVNFPIFNNTAYSEDNLNTTENTVANRRKVRFYALKNADGSVVPNAYVFTSEDFINDPTGGYDTNDFIGIVRNVRGAPVGNSAGLTLQNIDGEPYPDRMVFNRIEVQPPGKRLDFNPATGKDDLVVFPPNNIVHDVGTMRLVNTGGSPITITGTALDSGAWQFVAKPADGTVLQPGESFDIKVKFVAHGLRPGHSGNETNDPTGKMASKGSAWSGSLTVNSDDPANPTRTIQLAGWWQKENENAEEPNLETMVNKLFGYQTTILNAGQTTDTGGKPVAIGEEVLGGYFTRADATLPVSVRMLAAYHTQGDEALLNWYTKAGTFKTITNQDGDQGQSFFPTYLGKNSGGTFSPTTAFGFKVNDEWSDDSYNKRQVEGDLGHHIRFFPVRDRAGNVIPNTYLMGVDYQARNFDYQDDVYLISNVKPSSA